MGGTDVTIAAEPRKTDFVVRSEGILQTVEDAPQLRPACIARSEYVQEQAVQPRFHVNRVRAGDPRARAVAGLAPHAQRGQPFGRSFLSQFAEDLRQRSMRNVR